MRGASTAILFFASQALPPILRAIFSNLIEDAPIVIPFENIENLIHHIDDRV